MYCGLRDYGDSALYLDDIGLLDASVILLRIESALTMDVLAVLDRSGSDRHDGRHSPAEIQNHGQRQAIRPRSPQTKTPRAAKARPGGCNDFPERRDGDEDCLKFYRIRKADDAHAVVGRETADAADLDDAIGLARRLWQTLNMPQRPDAMSISDNEGNRLYSGTLDTAKNTG